MSLRNSDLVSENDGVQFQMEGVQGLVYTLQATTDFTSWVDIQTAVPDGNDRVQLSDIEPVADSPMRFYRVIISRE